MDAFEEGYHINGIHPQLLSVLVIDPTTARYRFFENHSVAVAPFEVKGASAEKQIEGILNLPDTFPRQSRSCPASRSWSRNTAGPTTRWSSPTA